jgi:uncharacterized protein YndB with AHSA1/START domain
MQGHLVIADISGYTQFLTDSELEHGNGIIADLLNSIINATTAPLTLSSIEGDAVFLYGEMTDGMYGQTILESVELLYCAFADALSEMVVNTTCDCNACVNINGLGLKIAMHCGEYVISNVGGMTTLSGPDVIAVHRLMKNHIIEKTGIEHYFLITDQCVKALEVEAVVASWTPHTEEYEHIGEVAGYVSSLEDVYAMLQLQTEDKVPQAGAWSTSKGQTLAPPALVWDYIMDPRKRVEFIPAAAKMNLEELAAGRIAPGTEFHCAHGDGAVTLFKIKDMRPHSYITMTVEFAEGSLVKYTYYLIPSGSGTRIFQHAEAPSIDGVPVPELAGDDYRNAWFEMMQENINILTQLADETVRESLTA